MSCQCSGMLRAKIAELANTKPARLGWTRKDLVLATGLCPRSIQNLEYRGLLQRIPIGLKTAVYSTASVEALFGQKQEAQ